MLCCDDGRAYWQQFSLTGRAVTQRSATDALPLVVQNVWSAEILYKIFLYCPKHSVFSDWSRCCVIGVFAFL